MDCKQCPVVQTAADNELSFEILQLYSDLALSLVHSATLVEQHSYHTHYTAIDKCVIV